MKIKCIEKFYSSDPVFNSIQSGDWFEAYETQSIIPNKPSKHYFMIKGNREYALDKKFFITEQEWREQQINKIVE